MLSRIIQSVLLPSAITASNLVNFWMEKWIIYRKTHVLKMDWYNNKNEYCDVQTEGDSIEDLLKLINDIQPIPQLDIVEFPELALFLKNYSNNYIQFCEYLDKHGLAHWKNGKIFRDVENFEYRFLITGDIFYFETV